MHIPKVVRLVVAVAALSNTPLGAAPRCICPSPQTSACDLQTFDVIVVGAGTGGTAAAIQAARMGSSVALLEETSWIGGQMLAAGVTSIDGGNIQPAGLGVFREYIDLVKQHYLVNESGKPTNTAYFGSGTAFEPSIGQGVLTNMLCAHSGIAALVETGRLTAIVETGRVVGVSDEQGREWRAPVTIDATEYGDIIASTPARYRVGNVVARQGLIETNPLPVESCVQDITQLAVLRKYARRPDDALRFTSQPSFYDSGDDSDFRTAVSTSVPYPPLSYPAPVPWSWPYHNAYRGMPDSTNLNNYTGQQGSEGAITRTGLNMVNDYPGGDYNAAGAFVNNNGTLGITYVEDRTQRQAVNCKAKLRTLNFIAYIQLSMGLGRSSWSVADDEGYDTAVGVPACSEIPSQVATIASHLPVVPYVRESRRIVSLYDLRASDVRRDGSNPRSPVNFKTSVAVGDYATDLHNCKENGLFDMGETTGDLTTGTGPFQIPFRSLIPEAMDGLVAAEKNIGQSRIVAGATRLQPVTMATGQAAGAIAALAAQGGIDPRAVRPIDVQVAVLDDEINKGSGISRYDFSDIPYSSPYWAPAQLMSTYGIQNAYADGRFGVDDVMPWWQAAVTIVRLFGDPIPQNPPQTFADVPPSHGAFAQIEAFTPKYTSGCSATLFCPDNPLLRSQLAKFISVGLGLDITNPPTVASFVDVPTTHPHYAYVEAVKSQGIMLGCSVSESGVVSFCPDTAVTRGVFAVVGKRTLPKRQDLVALVP